MRYLTVEEVLELHRRIIEQSGGAAGVRDIDSVHAAVARPQMEFEGRELYPDIDEKAAVGIAAGNVTQDEFSLWLRNHITKLDSA